jgi:hypothetical protein
MMILNGKLKFDDKGCGLERRKEPQVGPAEIKKTGVHPPQVVDFIKNDESSSPGKPLISKCTAKAPVARYA